MYSQICCSDVFTVLLSVLLSPVAFLSLSFANTNMTVTKEVLIGCHRFYLIVCHIKIAEYISLQIHNLMWNMVQYNSVKHSVYISGRTLYTNHFGYREIWSLFMYTDFHRVRQCSISLYLTYDFAVFVSMLMVYIAIECNAIDMYWL